MAHNQDFEYRTFYRSPCLALTLDAIKITKLRSSATCRRYCKYQIQGTDADRVFLWEKSCLRHWRRHDSVQRESHVDMPSCQTD